VHVKGSYAYESDSSIAMMMVIIMHHLASCVEHMRHTGQVARSQLSLLALGISEHAYMHTHAPSNKRKTPTLLER
jgi:hypothetical protein